MLKLGGNNISKMYLGGNAISKAYLGSNLVYSAAQPLPYDYEVEYIERDYGVPWLVDGASASGGFDLMRYVDGESFNTTTQMAEMAWSFVPEASLLRFVFRLTASALNGGKAHFCKANNYTTYCFGVSAGSQTDVVGDIDQFHVQKHVFDGSGNVSLYIDGSKFAETHMTGAIKFCSLLYGQYTLGSAFRARVKSLKIDDKVYLIPVVKGNAVGFYNMVDGELFLEEQECLSAGPRV